MKKLVLLFFICFVSEIFCLSNIFANLKPHRPNRGIPGPALPENLPSNVTTMRPNMNPKPMCICTPEAECKGTVEKPTSNSPVNKNGVNSKRQECPAELVMCCTETPDIKVGSKPAPKPGPAQPPKNPMKECPCVLEKECTMDMNVDIRIVNTGRQCQIGYVYCCQDGMFSFKCGEVKVISTKPKPINQAAYGSYPWQVELLDVNNKYIGGGAIINKQYIITAAHKVADFSMTNNYKIRLGRWDRDNDEEQTLEVVPVSTLIHEAFNRKYLSNDIALIKINRPIQFNKYVNINSVCLPNKPPTYKKCSTSGWGTINFQNNVEERILKEVDLSIIDPDKCEAQLRKTRLQQNFMLDRTSFICAGSESGKDACTGDGGGALVCFDDTKNSYEVVGLTSWGIGCADKDIPAAYVNVYSYLNWITENIDRPNSFGVNERTYSSQNRLSHHLYDD